MKTKKHVQQELESYFDKLVRTTTSPNLPISADIVRKYIFGPATLKTMMRKLKDELDRGARAVYPNVMEATFRF